MILPEWDRSIVEIQNLSPISFLPLKEKLEEISTDKIAHLMCGRKAFNKIKETEEKRNEQEGKMCKMFCSMIVLQDDFITQFIIFCINVVLLIQENNLHKFSKLSMYKCNMALDKMVKECMWVLCVVCYNARL